MASGFPGSTWLLAQVLQKLVPKILIISKGATVGVADWMKVEALVTATMLGVMPMLSGCTPVGVEQDAPVRITHADADVVRQRRISGWGPRLRVP